MATFQYSTGNCEGDYSWSSIRTYPSTPYCPQTLEYLVQSTPAKATCRKFNISKNLEISLVGLFCLIEGFVSMFYPSTKPDALNSAKRSFQGSIKFGFTILCTERCTIENHFEQANSVAYFPYTLCKSRTCTYDLLVTIILSSFLLCMFFYEYHFFC